MKITAQLALSQMKVNKKRTIAGIFAIALATSLITTVMCFVTSANKMLTDFLGSDYGEYGGAYSLMLAIPALLLGLLIAAMIYAGSIPVTGVNVPAMTSSLPPVPINPPRRSLVF